METFPYTAPADAPAVGFTRGPKYGTEVVVGMTGLEQRRKLMPLQRHPMVFTFPVRADITSLVQTVEEFFDQRGGMYEAFVIFDFDAAYVHKKIYAGVGNGIATAFTLPSHDGSSAHAVYLNNVLQSSGYVITDDGPNDRQKITFTPAPATGTIITVSFVGQRAFAGRFASDELTIRAEDAGLYSVSFPFISLIGEG